MQFSVMVHIISNTHVGNWEISSNSFSIKWIAIVIHNPLRYFSYVLNKLFTLVLKNSLGYLCCCDTGLLKSHFLKKNKVSNNSIPFSKYSKMIVPLDVIEKCP